MIVPGQLVTAEVTSVTPLEIQLPEATVSSPVHRKHSTVPALTIGDEVQACIDPFTRELVVIGKLVAA